MWHEQQEAMGMTSRFVLEANDANNRVGDRLGGNDHHSRAGVEPSVRAKAMRCRTGVSARIRRLQAMPKTSMKG
jgi:hypothetical protein